MHKRNQLEIHFQLSTEIMHFDRCGVSLARLKPFHLGADMTSTVRRTHAHPPWRQIIRVDRTFVRRTRRAPAVFISELITPSRRVLPVRADNRANRPIPESDRKIERTSGHIAPRRRIGVDCSDSALPIKCALAAVPHASTPKKSTNPIFCKSPRRRKMTSIIEAPISPDERRQNERERQYQL